uniref:Peptidase S9 prolyl oligopeptidase catalytic domain-containing protein n=1 Tax=Lactuca sativa TaxID=4236 RepID=A0A9R1X056_LACSA|nr:hypothetical protein LSAT_V11C800430240 [Lactuca sativa]
MKESTQSKRPTVVYLHPTNANKEYLCPLLEGYASHVYIAVAIDSRYHGERAKTHTAYPDVWDLIMLADYLTTQRPDIDHSKIGITGNSLGARIDLGKEAIDKEVVETVRSIKIAKCVADLASGWRLTIVAVLLFDQVIVKLGIGHDVTPSMLKEVSDWLDKFLKP